MHTRLSLKIISGIGMPIFLESSLIGSALRMGCLRVLTLHCPFLLVEDCTPARGPGAIVGGFFFFFLIILYSSCIAYDRPELRPIHFLVSCLCSRVGPLPYNPARHPAFIKAPRLLRSVPSYLLVLVVATADPHLLSLPRSSTLHVP
jgi:hypothetical protein